MTQSESPNTSAYTDVFPVDPSATKINPMIDNVLAGKGDVVDLLHSFINRVLGYYAT